MRTHVGVQALQGLDFAERGVARYVGDLADALWRWDRELICSFVLDGAARLPGRLEPYVGQNVLRAGEELRPSPGDLYHLTSPFESTPLATLWPEPFRQSACRLVVTLYDVIPLLNQERYLKSEVARNWYANRLRLLGLADRIHAISQATADDAITHLGLRPDRLRVVGTGVSPIFIPAPDLIRARGSLNSSLPQLRGEFILCIGGNDWRKNLARLFSAYRALPTQLRENHQLVVVCKLDAESSQALRTEIESLGIIGQVLLTGVIPDSQLVQLYQTATLFVLPCLVEGFGLPLAEALACGAPSICSSIPSLREILPDGRAHFDPIDVRSISAAIERALTDPTHLAALRSNRLHPRHRWEAVAARTASSYREILGSRRNLRPRPVRIALVSPLPPQLSGVADYSAHLASALSRLCDLTVFVDDLNDLSPLPGVNMRLVNELDSAEATGGTFHRIVCAIGNQIYHISALQLLQRRRCTVIFHDIRLDGLWAWSAVNRPDFLPVSFHQRLQDQYQGRIPVDLGGRGWLERDEAQQWGIWMVGDIVREADEVFCHSRYAADMVLLDAGPSNTTPVGVLPFAHRPISTRSADKPFRLVATFGVVTAVKNLDLLLSAMVKLGQEDPTLRFAIVGPVSDDLRDNCLARVRSSQISDRFTITGWVDAPDYADWLARTSIAVQLRAATGGESSAAIADCFSAGVPTIVTDLGAQSELPNSCVEKVDRWITPEDLASTIRRLLDSPQRLATMRRAAQAYADARSFCKVAEELYERLVFGRDRGPLRLSE